MPDLKILVLSFALAASPAAALAHEHESAHPPCAASGGGLPDPAETRRCLAERYKSAKPKAPPPASAPASAPESPSTN